MDACAKSLEKALANQIDPSEFKALAQQQMEATKMAAQTKADLALSRAECDKRRLEIDEKKFGQEQALFKFQKIEKMCQALATLRTAAETAGGSGRMKDAADKLEMEIEALTIDAIDGGDRGGA